MHDYIKEYVRANKKGERANLASHFWVKFHQEFNLANKKFTRLDSTDDVKTDEDINDSLLTAFAQAHDSNPAQRRLEPALNYLEYSSECSLTELKFMIDLSRMPDDDEAIILKVADPLAEVHWEVVSARAVAGVLEASSGRLR